MLYPFQYVAEVRRKDWKKCCPFDLSSYSPESTFQAERVFASLILEDNDALINTPENTQAPNSLIYFEVRNPEGQAAESETHTENMLVFAVEVIGNDPTSIINDTSLESASGKVSDADCQIEKAIYGDMVAAENDMPEDVVVVDHSLKDIVTDGASKSSSRKLKDTVQNQNDMTEDVVVVDHSQKDIVMDGASKSSSRKLKDDVQYQNENSVCEDIIDAGNETHIGVDDDGANANSDEERNLAGEKPQKFRLLSDIYNQLQGPCDAVSAGYGDRDISSESEEDDSDEFTLETCVRKKKGVQVNSKTGVASKKGKRLCKERERSFVRAKRMKRVPADSYRKDSELGSKRHLRKSRTDVVALQVMKKHKKSLPEIIMHGSTSVSQKVSPSSLRPEENRAETEKDSLLSCGNKRRRETIQDDYGRDVSKFMDRSQRHFTEGNRSRSTHGVNSVQLVHPTIATLYSIETASGCVQKSVKENSPPTDNEFTAALLLLSLFNSGVTTHTSSKTAAKNPAVSLLNSEILCGIDEKVSPASGSIMNQSHEEFNIINDSGLPQAVQVESGTSVCLMNMNPSEFSILNTKKYMRRAKVIQK
ncbi:hypothetical protein Lser_V15G18154 [Lactuca serriola]